VRFIEQWGTIQLCVCVRRAGAQAHQDLKHDHGHAAILVILLFRFPGSVFGKDHVDATTFADEMKQSK